MCGRTLFPCKLALLHDQSNEQFLRLSCGNIRWNHPIANIMSIPIPLAGLDTSLGKALGRGLVGSTSRYSLGLLPGGECGSGGELGGDPPLPRPTNLNLHRTSPTHQLHPEKPAVVETEILQELPRSPSVSSVTRERGPQRAASPTNGEPEGWVWPGLAVGGHVRAKCALGREGAARLQRTHQSDNARPRSETSQWENRSTTKIYLGTTT